MASVIETRTLDHITGLLRDYAEANEWDVHELPSVADDTRYLGLTANGVPISIVVNVTP